MTEKCMFLEDDACAILEQRRCGGCKFRKTEKGYQLAQERAEAILRRKGLKATTKAIDKKRWIVTTEKDENQF